MSANYAAGLSYYPFKGKCGQEEFAETAASLSSKINQMVEMVNASKHLVVLTGAGISTPCGIPDFRGPQGVWTLEEKEGKTPQFKTTFDDANASKGHMALVMLEKAGVVKYLITQNVDGLHLRSGFPRNKLSILHGDMFIQKCDKCNYQYAKISCSPTMGLKHTGAACVQTSKRGNSCRGKLKDTILDWEDELPDNEMEPAIENCRKADVVLVLGSSLQITPAGNLPLYCRKSGGKIISVNLQRTKHHKKTDLVIHSRIDTVIDALCKRLGVIIPTFSQPCVHLYSTAKDSNMTNSMCSITSVDPDLLLKNDLKRSAGSTDSEKNMNCQKLQVDSGIDEKKPKVETA